MLGPVLRRLIDRGATSVRAIEDATGRGESTVYRWLAEQTRPDVRDLRAILRRLDGRPVRQAVLNALIHDLPVTTIWHDPPLSQRPTLPPEQALREALRHSTSAMRKMSDLLAEEVELHGETITAERCVQLAAKIDEIVHHLAESRLVLCAGLGKRRRAV